MNIQNFKLEIVSKDTLLINLVKGYWYTRFKSDLIASDNISNYVWWLCELAQIFSYSYAK